MRIYLELEIRRVDCKACGTVKQEKPAWLEGNPFVTKRFAFFAGRRCRTMTIKDLNCENMREQLKRAGKPAPKVIGIDEISIRKGHTCRIVVSDLDKRRPVWFGGQDRSEASMDEFFKSLGSTRSKGIRLAVMDMWKAFRISTLKAENTPQAAILFDKFHVMHHLGVALD